MTSFVSADHGSQQQIAVRLLEAAAKRGYTAGVVKAVFGGFQVPDSVAAEFSAVESPTVKKASAKGR